MTLPPTDTVGPAANSDGAPALMIALGLFLLVVAAVAVRFAGVRSRSRD